MNRSFAAGIVALVILAAGCEREGSRATGLAETAVATVTPTYPAPLPETPTRTPIPNHVPLLVQPAGPLAVYSTEHFAADSGGVRYVRAFDTGTGAEWAAFSYGGLGEPPRGEGLASGRLIVYATNRRVEARALDRGTPRLLYQAPPGVAVTDISVSHDEKLVAVTTFFKDSVGKSLSDLILLDISEGVSGPSPAALKRTFHSTDPQLAGGFYGYFMAPQWLAGDAGVMIVGANQKDGPGARATLFMDGRIQVHRPAWRMTSPDGQYAFVSPGSPCFAGGSDRFEIVGAATDQPVATVITGREGVFAQEWLPDSSVVLYFTFDDPGDGCSDGSKLKYWLQPVSGESPAAVADLDALRRRVYQPHMFELTCPGGRLHPVAPPIGAHLQCDTSQTAGSLTIGGRPAGSAANIRTLGVIP